MVEKSILGSPTRRRKNVTAEVSTNKPVVTPIVVTNPSIVEEPSSEKGPPLDKHNGARDDKPIQTEAPPPIVPDMEEHGYEQKPDDVGESVSPKNGSPQLEEETSGPSDHGTPNEDLPKGHGPRQSGVDEVTPVKGLEKKEKIESDKEATPKNHTNHYGGCHLDHEYFRDRLNGIFAKLESFQNAGPRVSILAKNFTDFIS
jgi:hypothetical protein